MDKISLNSIRNYTATRIERLVAEDPPLQPVSELLESLVTGSAPLKESEMLSDDQAAEAIKFSVTDAIPEVFTGDEVRVVHRIAQKMLELAVAADNQRTARLVRLATYLQPLLSQDRRTERIGWDLTEYMDWYFAVPSRAERERYAQELLADWRLD